jgi:hypothetical protein
MQHTLIIQCSSYFEYKHLKDSVFISNSTNTEFFDKTYTMRMFAYYEFDPLIPTIIRQAPNCKLTRKLTKNNKSTYIKLKD